MSFFGLVTFLRLTFTSRKQLHCLSLSHTAHQSHSSLQSKPYISQPLPSSVSQWAISVTLVIVVATDRPISVQSAQSSIYGQSLLRWIGRRSVQRFRLILQKHSMQSQKRSGLLLCSSPWGIWSPLKDGWCSQDPLRRSELTLFLVGLQSISQWRSASQEPYPLDRASSSHKHQQSWAPKAMSESTQWNRHYQLGLPTRLAHTSSQVFPTSCEGISCC